MRCSLSERLKRAGFSRHAAALPREEQRCAPFLEASTSAGRRTEKGKPHSAEFCGDASTRLFYERTLDCQLDGVVRGLFVAGRNHSLGVDGCRNTSDYSEAQRTTSAIRCRQLLLPRILFLRLGNVIASGFLQLFSFRRRLRLSFCLTFGRFGFAALVALKCVVLASWHEGFSRLYGWR